MLVGEGELELDDAGEFGAVEPIVCSTSVISYSTFEVIPTMD